MTNRMRVLLCTVSACILLYSCSKEERAPCLQPRTTVLLARSYHHADTGNAIRDTSLPNPQLRPLTDGLTQYIFGGQKRISAFTFTLSNIADSSRWIIRPDSAFAIEDTLTFRYQRQLRFLSNSCGYTNYYNLLGASTTTNAIDSVIIKRPDITSDANVVNLNIYY